EVIKPIDHRDEWMLGQRLFDQVPVEALQHFSGWHEPIASGGNLLCPHAFFYENRQQTRRYSVPHRVGHVEADMVLIEAKDVVKVAADTPTEHVADGKTEPRHLGQRLRQKTELDALSQLQLLVDLLVSLLEPLVDAVDLGALIGEAVVDVLE